MENTLKAPRNLQEGELFVEVVSPSAVITQGTRLTVTRERAQGRHFVVRLHNGKGWVRFHGVLMLASEDFVEVTE
jgi:hypothetical protein